MATALSTINKFVIKKKTGENDRIFGRSVLLHYSSRMPSVSIDWAPAVISISQKGAFWSSRHTVNFELCSQKPERMVNINVSMQSQA